MITLFENFTKKICSKCGDKKETSEFYKKGNSTRPECKLCTNSNNKTYRKNNKNFVEKLRKEYRKTDKSKKSEKKYSDNYRKNIPIEVHDKLRSSHKLYCRNRYNSDSQYKLIVSIRNIIGRAFRCGKKPLKTQ